MNVVIRNIGDELGTAKILLLQARAIGLEAIVVSDNTACGPAIGGVRMATDVWPPMSAWKRSFGWRGR